MRIVPESKGTLGKIVITGFILIFCTSWFHLLYSLGRVEIVYSYLYYIPIVFGAFFYGIAGGLMVSSFAALTYSIFISASGIPYENRDLFPGVLSFLLIGLLTGLLSSRLERRVKQVLKLYGEVTDAYMGAVRALAVAVDEKDHYTRTHSENVTKYAVAVSKELGFSQEKVKEIERASRLHDIGKIGIHDYILTKADKLTSEEWDEIRLHPSKGAKILEPLHFLGEIVDIIKYHHERYDGRGYPSSKEKGNIPLGSRIIAVADAFDAMTSDRPYRKSMGRDVAIEELKKNSGTQFDPDVVRAFLAVLEKHGV